MKLTEAQKKVLVELTKSFIEGLNQPHPRDSFKENVLDALEKKGLIQYGTYKSYLHGSVKLTDLGRETINES